MEMIHEARTVPAAAGPGFSPTIKFWMRESQGHCACHEGNRTIQDYLHASRAERGKAASRRPASNR